MSKRGYFSIEELVPPETIEYYEARGGKERAWEIFSDDAILFLNNLRADLGPCTLNDWSWGGHIRYRGFRPAGCGVGADYSMHRLGKGFDVVFRDATAEEARELVRRNRERYYWATCIELGKWKGGKKEPIDWLHADSRNVSQFKEIWA